MHTLIYKYKKKTVTYYKRCKINHGMQCNEVVNSQLIPCLALELFNPTPTFSVLELFNDHSTGDKKHENVNLTQKSNIKP